MNTKFPLLIAAGLLLTVATTQAQNNSKKYAANYPAHSSATMNKPESAKSNDRPFQKNANTMHHQPGKHHHHHGHGHHK
jgi:hypothetical protein